MTTGDPQLEAFHGSLQQGGERAALEYLSTLTGFRFVALILYKDGRGHPIFYFDRANPDITEADEIDQRASYCSRVIADQRIFQTANSTVDERLLDHPARDFVKAYFGLPIFALDGTVHAVLCHFDVTPQDIANLDAGLLTHAAAAFERRLPGYRLAAPASRVTEEYSEKRGNVTLYVIERSKPEWSAPRYSVERSRISAGGIQSSRQVYGRDGFSSFAEALEFGREWCRPESQP